MFVDGHAARFIHIETTGLMRERMYEEKKSERKQHLVLLAVDFKEAAACVSAQQVRNWSGVAKHILMHLLWLLMNSSILYFLPYFLTFP